MLPGEQKQMTGKRSNRATCSFQDASGIVHQLSYLRDDTANVVELEQLVSKWI